MSVRSQNLSLLVFLSFFSVLAAAQTELNCDHDGRLMLSGRLELTQNVVLSCNEIVVDPVNGAQIITGEHQLALWTMSGLSEKLTIKCFDEPAKATTKCGSVTLYSMLTGSGQLLIDTQCPNEASDCLPGDIQVVFGSTDNMVYDLHPGKGAQAQLTRMGTIIAGARLTSDGNMETIIQ